MTVNIIHNALSIRSSSLCLYDTNVAFETDFSVNGNVDGWDYFKGINTYGCWNGVLFGTLVGTTPTIGRETVFSTIDTKNYYTIKILMKYDCIDRRGSQKPPTLAKIAWRTVSSPIWNTEKEMVFNINPDANWHEYVLNMGEEQWWQGYVYDLRFYPVIDGLPYDNFFIKSIKVISIDTFKCKKTGCSAYPNYTHNCPGAGERGCIEASITDSRDRNIKINSDGKYYYSIKDGINDVLVVNINDYGYENIRIDLFNDREGSYVAKILNKNISSLDIGGYAEAEVIYNDNKFIIYTGTTTDDSNIKIAFSPAAVTLGFYDLLGNPTFTEFYGKTPATLFSPVCSFKLKSSQILDLFDYSKDTDIGLDPNIYMIEGGRSDWSSSGKARANIDSRYNTTGTAVDVIRRPPLYKNEGKTIIDFSHPFNASGRIRKIYAACTLDRRSGPPSGDENWHEGDRVDPTDSEGGELYGAKVLILRPRRDGALFVVKTLDIPDRNRIDGALYSQYQENIEINCDIWVNKGDLIGIYNANIYIGKTVTGNEIDAIFYQFNGLPIGVFNPGRLYGDGSAGLPFYGRSEEKQSKFIVDIDLGYRYNLSDITVYAKAENSTLDFNIARCLDINWEVSLYNATHITGYMDWKGEWQTFEHNNIAFGTSNLSDGIYEAPDGLAGRLTGTNSDGLVVSNPTYFFVNGDGEWVNTYQWGDPSKQQSDPFASNFSEDPVSFKIFFPNNTKNKIGKFKVYFKESNNFRNFSLSTYNGALGDMGDFKETHGSVEGNVNEPNFSYIKEYKVVTVDNVRYEKDGSEKYESVKDYLFRNPSIAKDIFEATGPAETSWEQISSDYMGGGVISRSFYQPGKILNYEEATSASYIDWLIIEHEFGPIDCHGFMFYCDFHKSTKIFEMELYCASREISSSLAGLVNTSYSLYNETWWSANLSEEKESIKCAVNDTPRYISIEISPITSMRLKDVNLELNRGDLFLGAKGCNDVVPVEVSKLGEINQSKRINIKNVYGYPYDLYVDIQKDNIIDDGLLFYSTLTSAEAVSNPEFGVDGRYKKEPDYPLLNSNGNIAINCDCFGLEDLSANKKVWVTDDDGYSWYEWGTITKGQSIDFSNIPSMTYTILEFPALSKNKFWKIKFKCKDHLSNVSEIRVYYENQELEVVNFYHDKNRSIELPMLDRAPHLDNYSTRGSYYTLNNVNFIGFELASQQKITKIVLFHSDLPDYSNSLYKFGIDHYTALSLIEDYYADNIYDYSYNELQVNRNNVLVQRENYIAKTFNYEKDFFTCTLTDWTIWEPYESSYPDFFNYNCVNGTIVSGIENAGYVEGIWNGTDIQPYYGGYWGAIYKSIEEVYESWRFVLDMKIKFTQIAGIISFGFLRSYYWGSINWERQHYWGGCHIAIDSSGRMSLVVHDDTNQYDVPEWDEVNGSSGDIDNNTECYLRLESDGNGNYRARVWYDNWDTGTLRRDLSLYSTRRWRANKLGVGGGGGGSSTVCRFYSVNLHDSYAYLKKGVQGDACSEFNGSQNSYLSIPYSNELDLSNNRFNFDFHVNFYSLPAEGESVVLAKIWPDSSYTGSSGPINLSRSWAFIFRNTGTSYVLEFHCCYNNYGYYKLLSYAWTPQTNRWYHILYTRGPTDYDWYRTKLVIDKYTSYVGADFNQIINVGSSPLIIGQGLNGLIDGFRLSKSPNSVAAGGRIGRYDYIDDPAFFIDEWERLYTFQLYVSNDNNNFGHYASVDACYDGSFSYFSTNNVYSSGYYTKFAIDLEERHKLWLVRTFGDTTNRHNISVTDNMIYSNSITTNPYEIDINSTYEDAKWAIITLYNGNETTYTIRRIGIYPDITESVGPGGNHYNCDWIPLGKSITSFNSSRNLSINKTISASSQFGRMYPYNLIDGIVSTDFNNIWGSDNSTTQWIEIDLEEEYQIYRVKIYHGLNDSDTNYMVKNYNVQYKLHEDDSYINIFTITNNTSNVRTHDLYVPVSARYIRIYITSYISKTTSLSSVDDNIEFFSGAVLREIEVYEYYGFNSISSEEYPVVCINLNDQFQMTGHSLTGMNAENTSIDWVNSNSNFTYANFVRTDPRKIYFEPWGSDVGFGQWVAIMRNTATDLDSGPDLLKGVIISADKANPSEHHWWWNSDFSYLSTTYDVPGNFATAGLDILYPASSGVDTICLIEGDDFGIDSYLSWRDYLNFNWYIEDISKLDLTYGEFYFGGKDCSIEHNILLYRWYFSVISGTLMNGWNNVELEFRMCDKIDYIANESDIDPRTLDLMTMSTFGITFKGLGESIHMKLEGFKIKRNHFNAHSDYVRGLYLTHRDFLTMSLGDIDISKGTIEFFMRPDYHFDGKDIFNKRRNRSLFHIGNNSNDMFGAMITNYGITVYYGNLINNLMEVSLELPFIDYFDTFFHIAFVFSNDGSMDDGSTIRIYINNVLSGNIYDKWAIEGNRYFTFIVGGQGVLGAKKVGSAETASIDAILSHMKIYNYCKTNFLDSMSSNVDIYDETLIKPNQLIEISKDNLTFHKVGSTELPFFFDDVPNGEEVPIYIRSTLPSKMTGKEKRTAGLLVSWDIGV